MSNMPRNPSPPIEKTNQNYFFQKSRWDHKNKRLERILAIKGHTKTTFERRGKKEMR